MTGLKSEKQRRLRVNKLTLLLEACSGRVVLRRRDPEFATTRRKILQPRDNLK